MLQRQHGETLHRFTATSSHPFNGSVAVPSAYPNNAYDVGRATLPAHSTHRAKSGAEPVGHDGDWNSLSRSGGEPGSFSTAEPSLHIWKCENPAGQRGWRRVRQLNVGGEKCNFFEVLGL